jgi:hypothetical protein
MKITRTIKLLLALASIGVGIFLGGVGFTEAHYPLNTPLFLLGLGLAGFGIVWFFRLAIYD